MLRQLVDAWQQVPRCLRVLIGLQVVAAGVLMRVLAHPAANANEGPAGFTIGLGLAVAALAVRSRFAHDEAADRDRE